VSRADRECPTALVSVLGVTFLPSLIIIRRL
jgi:hypothetical protein